MPSFFSLLKNIALGKPVYTNQQTTQSAQPAAQQPTQTVSGPKVVPQAYIERVECTENGANMQCDATIQNYSQVPLDLDRIEILGTSFDLGTILRPGEEREFRIYSGPRITNTGNNQCKLYYKDPSTDTFCAQHTIDFEKLADNTYTINRIRFLNIADV